MADRWKLTQDEKEDAFVLRHSAWNRALVLLGPDGEAKATRMVLQSFEDDNPNYVADFGVPTHLRTDDASIFEWMQENDLLDDWELFEEARVEE